MINIKNGNYKFDHFKRLYRRKIFQYNKNIQYDLIILNHAKITHYRPINAKAIFEIKELRRT